MADLTLGQRHTGRVGAADVKERDIQEKVVLTQSERVPFSSFMLALGSESTKAAKFEHGEDDFIPPILKINGALGTTNPIVAVVDPDHASRAVIGAMVWNKTTGEYLLITDRNVIAETVTMSRAQGTVPATAIADNEELIIVSEAREEGVELASAQSSELTLHYNYTQEIETAVEMSWKQMGTKDYTEKDWDYQVRKAAAEQKEKLERMLFLGIRKLTTGAEGKRLYHSGGMYEWIIDSTYGWPVSTDGSTGYTSLSSILSKGVLDAWLSQPRVYGNPSRKAMFGSPFAWRVLSSLADSYVKIDRSEKTLGVTIKKVEILGNMIPFIENQQLSRMGVQDYLFLFDLDFLKLRHLEANDLSGRMKWHSNVQNPRLKGRHDVIRCDMGLMRKNAKAHGLLKGFTG